MNQQLHDSGMLSVMIENIERGSIPRALSLLEKVNRGETINDFDIAFLDKEFSETRELMPMFNRHPEYQDLAARVLGLYEQITQKAFENEMSSMNG